MLSSTKYLAIAVMLQYQKRKDRLGAHLPLNTTYAGAVQTDMWMGFKCVSTNLSIKQTV